MKKILQAIKSSYFKSLKGEENFWVVLLCWGVGVYLINIVVLLMWGIMFLALNLLVKSYILGNLYVISTNNEMMLILLTHFLSLVAGTIGSIGIILVFFYPLVLALMLIKCSIMRGKIYTLFSVVLLFIILPTHYTLVFTIPYPFSPLFATHTLINLPMLETKLGIIFTAAVFIYIVIKTIKSLSAKTPN